MLQPHGPTVPLFFSLSRNGCHSRDLVIHHGSFKTGDLDRRWKKTPSTLRKELLYPKQSAVFQHERNRRGY